MSAPDIKDIINSVNNENDNDNNNSNTDNVNLEHLKVLEVAKIIINETLKEKNIKSLSFLNAEQVDDIVKARLLNNYYCIPEIDNYINDFLQLKRSESGQLINLFVKMIMYNNNQENDINKKGFFSRILKR